MIFTSIFNVQVNTSVRFFGGSKNGESKLASLEDSAMAEILFDSGEVYEFKRYQIQLNELSKLTYLALVLKSETDCDEHHKKITKDFEYLAERAKQQLQFIVDAINDYDSKK